MKSMLSSVTIIVTIEYLNRSFISETELYFTPAIVYILTAIGPSIVYQTTKFYACQN